MGSKSRSGSRLGAKSRSGSTLTSIASLLLVAAVAHCGGEAPRPVAQAPPAPSSPIAHGSASPDAGGALPPEITQAQACSLPVQGIGEALPGAHPFAPAVAHCADKNPFCDEVETSPDPEDACFVANDNLRRAERESRASSAASARSTPWDHKTPPAFLPRVDAHLHFNDAERALFDKNGFVAFERLPYPSYAHAYHDIFQQELPVYVSVDSILQAVFQSNGAILEHIEIELLGPRLYSMLAKLRTTLAASRGVYDATTLGDLDVYLAVPRALLTPDSAGNAGGKLTLFGHDDAAEALVTAAQSASELAPVTLFGRERMIDFTQLTPRGHYSEGPLERSFKVPGGLTSLARYFEAMTWLSRLEFNLVSRSCRSSQPGDTPDPSETPREARDAIALADLVQRAGALGDLRELESVYSVFAGGREDVSIPDMLALMGRGGFSPHGEDAPDKLRAAIGNGFRRTARVHFMPQGAGELPAILTMMGPRIVPDIAPLTRLVHDSVQNRKKLGAADVGYVLGHDRARPLLAGDLSIFPELPRALDGARAELQRSSAGRRDLYGLWLGAVEHLADPPSGASPSFMQTDAYADMRMNSALVGYGQIRHNYVLLAGQGYDAYGCEIPDGYVEPALSTYDALLAYMRAARAADAKHAAYYDRASAVLAMLRSIVVTELSGAALSEPQRRWLGMVTEFIPTGGYGDSGEPPKYTGWYYDLYPDHEKGAEASPAFVADYFTLTNADEVRYLGAEAPRLAAFVVDTGGAPRVMVGPVAKGYEAATPIATRLTDESGAKAEHPRAPWLTYMAGDVADPPLRVQLFSCGGGEERAVLVSPARLGDVTLTLLDHHGDPLTKAVTRSVGPSPAVFVFRLPKDVADAPFGVEGLHVHVQDRSAAGLGHGPYDLVAGVSVYRPAMEETPTHPFQTLGSFSLGGLAPPEPTRLAPPVPRPGPDLGPQ